MEVGRLQERVFVGASKTANRKQSETIGQRVARLRQERGITQIELAERLGISQPVVSHYERDAGRLHSEFIIELADIFGVSADEILGIQPKKAKRGPKNTRLARRLQQLEVLPRRDQQAILRMIDAFLK